MNWEIEIDIYTSFSYNSFHYLTEIKSIVRDKA